MAEDNGTLKLDPKYDQFDYPIVSANTQSGHPGHTTPEQEAQVYQLRMKLEAAGYTDRLDSLTLVRTQDSSLCFPQLTNISSFDFCEPVNSMSPSQRRCTLRFPAQTCTTHTYPLA